MPAWLAGVHARPAMELRDVVGSLVALDDELRAHTNELNRAVDALSRALLPPERFGVDAERLAGLQERLGHGFDESSTLEALADELEERVAGDAWNLRERDEAAFRAEFKARLEELRGALEALGRLARLLERRSDAERRLARLKKGLDADEETTELLEVVLAAREAAADRQSHDSQAFLQDAMAAARDDGQLAGTAANVRALRDALAGGEDPGTVAGDLSNRIVDLAVHLGQRRDDLSRRLAALERDAERRQEISHGLFQAVTKASEVLDLATRLRARLDEEGLPDGALGPLKAACIEHGVITLLLELRRLRLDRADLDAAMQELSAALGDLFAALAGDPDRVERLGRVWEDLARLDAGAIEQEWEDAYAEVLGVRREGGGVLSVGEQDLAVLAGADGLDPWLNQLVRRLEEKLAAVTGLVERLEGDDRVLDELVDDERAGAAALRAKRSLALFVGEAMHAVQAYYSSVRGALLDPDSGFRRVQRQVAGFVHAEQVTPQAGAAERRDAFAATLEEVRGLFSELEAQLPAGGDATDWKVAEEEARNQVAGAYRDLAGTLARLQRLRALLFPPLGEACEEALALAARLEEEPAEPAGLVDPVEDVGEALEALYFEKLYHENLRLPSGSEVRAVAGLARVRGRRLLDLHGASLVLLFQLLDLLERQYDELPDEDRPGHLSWMNELLLHAREELDDHVARLDETLFELGDNAERLRRFLQAFDAYHRWASTTAESDAGLDLVEQHGKALFEGFEHRLARLGEHQLERLDAAEPDWRTSSAVESLAELYRMVEAELVSRPTMSRVEDSIAALRERAEASKQRIADAADADGSPFGGGPF